MNKLFNKAEDLARGVAASDPAEKRVLDALSNKSSPASKELLDSLAFDTFDPRGYSFIVRHLWAALKSSGRHWRSIFKGEQIGQSMRPIKGRQQLLSGGGKILTRPPSSHSASTPMPVRK
jgi:hypothetical protein